MKFSVVGLFCVLSFKRIGIGASGNEIQAIGSDELTRRFEFRGTPGPEGPIGPEGMVGNPGRAGDVGPMGPPGERGYRGEMGRPGKPGLKGEPAQIHVHRQLPGQHVITLQGEKGDGGRRGTKGERGMPGLTVVGQKGEAGTPAEFSYELKQSLKGEKGERGIPGRMLNCQNCYKARKRFPGKESTNEEGQKIYIPVQGPPGKDIVGSPGPKGEPGDSGRITKNHVIVLSYEEELSKIFDQHTFGTMAYVRTTETLFLQTERGWKEITFTGRFIDPYAHRRRHTRHKS